MPRSVLVLLLIVLLAPAASAQWKLQGTVYDSSRTYPLEAVTVQATNGRGTVTDGSGHYSIEVSNRDSVWFSYLGKPTQKFPVRDIRDADHFDISLRVPMKLLKEVIVKKRDYRQDSIANRQAYAKAFDFQRPNLSTMTSMGPGGAGIDINELIRVFQFRKNKRAERFRTRLLQQEEEKYIDNRFSRTLIARLTGLKGEDLARFQERFRPTLEFTRYSSDYDFQLYIKLCHEVWQGKTPQRPVGF
ncbi:carboxypeptidase-like regulatory domain-containing protein [Flaviaesturariibacter amylovorans]|uniref:Carboxypeptidase-like regulatory domain-containing protein n=1 Tax=Flaviaesturariibacter amylovorans TaxID=1084520 RepID=A0ABP8HTV5_9BACT